MKVLGASEGGRKAVEVYLNTQRSIRSRQTAQDALKRIVKLLTFGTSTDLGRLPWPTYEQAITVRTRLYEMNCAGVVTLGTVNLTLSHLRGLIRTMCSLGLVTPAQHELTHSGALKNISGSQATRGRALAPYEERELRRAARALGNKGGDYRGVLLDTAIVIAIGGGLRREEVGRLTLEGFGAKLLTVVGRDGKERRVRIDPVMRSAAESWVKNRDQIGTSHKYFFCAPQRPDWTLSPWSFWSLVRNAAHTAFGDVRCGGECQCHRVVTGPHDFRRTFAARLLNLDFDIRQVQVLMGHESPETTARYDKRDTEALFEKRRKVKVIA
jgi:integrase